MKARARKTRETRAAYRVRQRKTRISRQPRVTKLPSFLGKMPKGPSWQELEEWRDWQQKHIGDFQLEYPGKYLAIWKKKIIAIGRSWGEAFDHARVLEPDAVPWVTYIPTAEEMNLVPILIW